MNQNLDHQKHIALVFSIIFPGAGLIYQKKWLAGIAYGLFHLIIVGMLFKKIIETILYRHTGVPRGNTDIGELIIIGIIFLINWFANIRKTQNYE